MLEDARAIGLIGPGPVARHVEHALGFGEMCDRSGGPFLDLGSGAGLPGLVLAATWPESEWALVDAGARRGAFLGEAVGEVGLGTRVSIVVGRAEELGREAEMRGRFGTVVARGFGRPAVTAECAAGFLRVGGRAVVSEPPGTDQHRWSVDGLAELGMELVSLGQSNAGDHFAVINQTAPCPPRYPRRTGVPTKRPLF